MQIPCWTCYSVSSRSSESNGYYELATLTVIYFDMLRTEHTDNAATMVFGKCCIVAVGRLIVHSPR